MRRIIAAALLPLAFALPALAAPVKTIDGIVIITQADALAGGVTPGDAPGYPITITSAGSYRLGGPLTVTTGGANGFDVTAPLVTLDFGGFALDGAGIGNIGVLGSQRSLTVTNGTVRKFTSTGIISSATEMVVAHMRVDGVANAGILAYQTSGGLSDGRSIIRDNIVTDVAGDGINCGSQSCMVANNVVSDTTAKGIYISLLTNSSMIVDNVVSRAQDVGIDLDRTGAGVGRNTLAGNTKIGRPAPIGGIASPGSLGPNVCVPLPNPVPAGC